MNRSGLQIDQASHAVPCSLGIASSSWLPSRWSLRLAAGLLGAFPGNGRSEASTPCSLGSALTITSGLEPIRYSAAEV